MSNTVLPFGQLLRYLVECDDNERLLDSKFHTVLKLLKKVPYYNSDDDMETVVLRYVYEHLNNFQRKKCFLVSFLERWLEMDSITTAICGNMRRNNGNKANVILPFLFEGIKNNTDLTFQNIKDLIPKKVAYWVAHIHENDETKLLVLISTICSDKDLIKCIPWLKRDFKADLLFQRTKYPCGKREGPLLSVALAHYSHDNEENNKLTKTAKDLCVFLNLKGSLQNVDNEYCMTDVLYYITSGLEQEVPELEERKRVLTIECNRFLLHGLA